METPTHADLLVTKVYTVDCFTPQSEGGRFPDNSYSVDTVEEVGEILANVSRPAAGISKVEIFILENSQAQASTGTPSVARCGMFAATTTQTQ